VLKLDEVLTVVDSKSWMKTQEALIKRPAWLCAQRSDFSDECIKYIEVGFHKHNKIFIAVSRGKECVQIGLTEISEIRRLPPGKHVIFTYKGNHPEDRKITWNASGLVAVEGAEGEEKKFTVQLALQSCSDPQPQIEELELKDTGFTFTHGNSKLLQSAFPTVYKKYSVPESVYTGPTLEQLNKKIEETAPVQKPFDKNKSEGDSSLVVEQVDKVYPSETWMRDNVYRNYFMVQVRVQNSSHHDEPIFLTKVDSEYLNSSGQWVPTESSDFGSKSGYYNYNWSRKPYNIAFSKKDSALSALRADIPISNFPQADQKRRVHYSLPYPLNIRWILTDNTGKSTKFTVECYHEDKLEPISKEKKRKRKPQVGLVDSM